VTATIHHQVAIDAPPAKVYAAIATADGISTGYDERSEFFESNKTAWGQVLENLKRVLEARRG